MRSVNMLRKLVTVVSFAVVVPLLAGASLAQEFKTNRVKELLRTGNPAYGALMTLPSAPATEILAHAGLDWLCIDLEHGAINLETAHRMIQATQGSTTIPLVRIAWNTHWLAKPALDMGAMGIVFPFIKSREEAIAAVESVRYPPEGTRGFGPGFAALRWGMSVQDYVKAANREIMTVLLIEHVDAVDRIEEIVTVPGVDSVFLGTYDLSGTMGLLGQTTHPRVEDAVQKVLAAGKKAGVAVGIVELTPEGVNRRIQQGFRLVMVGTDTRFLSSGAKGILGDVRK